MTGDVPKEKAGTESKCYGKREVPYPLFVKTRLSFNLALKKRLPGHFVFRNAPVSAEKDLKFLLK